MNSSHLYSDILFLITSRMNNLDLHKLSLSGLWNQIKIFSQDQYWWYLRCRSLTQYSLLSRSRENWKRGYFFLDKIYSLVCREDINPFTIAYEDKLATSILIEIGHDPSMNSNEILKYSIPQPKNQLTPSDISKYIRSKMDVVDALQERMNSYNIIEEFMNDPCNAAYLSEKKPEMSTDVLEIILSDERVNISAYSNIVMLSYITKNRIEDVKNLLSDPRIDLTHISKCIIECVRIGDGEDILQLFLSDERIDNIIIASGSNLLSEAVLYNRLQVTKILLSDPRIDPTENSDDIFCHCMYHNKIDILKILLEDGRIDSSRYIRLIQYDGEGYSSEVRDLLLSSSRLRDD